LEEAAFISEEMFNTLIVPFLGVKHTTFIGISTPGDSENWYSQLLELPGLDGEDTLFQVMRFERSCLKCKRAEIACEHMRASIPFWKSISRQKIVELILKNNPRMMQREALGIVTDDHVYLFPREVVRSIRDSERFYLRDRSVNVVFLGIDPDGGAGQSDYALVSLTTHRGADSRRFVVLTGVDGINTRNYKDVTSMILAHMDAIMNSTWRGSHVLFVVCMEANMSFYGPQNMIELMHTWARERHDRSASIYGWKFDEERYGIWTREKLKMVGALSATIHSHAFAIGDALVSGKPDEAELHTLLDEMSHVRLEEKPAHNDAYDSSRLGVTGKGGGRKDDRFMALIMAHHVIDRMNRNNEFLRYCLDHNVPLCF
jgi:hypothetical protein